MTYCGCRSNIDHPLRAKFLSGNVVHAARRVIMGPSTSYKYVGDGAELIEINRPQEEVLNTACRRQSRDLPKKLIEVDHTETITCKACMAVMGMIDGEKGDGVRYVLQRLDTNEYFKKQGWCGKWKIDPINATLYQIRSAAESYGMKTLYFLRGESIPYDRYKKLSDVDRRSVNTERVFDEDNFAIRKITITLE